VFTGRRDVHLSASNPEFFNFTAIVSYLWHKPVRNLAYLAIWEHCSSLVERPSAFVRKPDQLKFGRSGRTGLNFEAAEWQTSRRASAVTICDIEFTIPFRAATNCKLNGNDFAIWSGLNSDLWERVDRSPSPAKVAHFVNMQLRRSVVLPQSAPNSIQNVTTSISQRQPRQTRNRSGEAGQESCQVVPRRGEAFHFYRYYTDERIQLWRKWEQAAPLEASRVKSEVAATYSWNWKGRSLNYRANFELSESRPDLLFASEKQKQHGVAQPKAIRLQQAHYSFDYNRRSWELCVTFVWSTPICRLGASVRLRSIWSSK